MMILLVVLGFIAPVILVFVYSIWMHRRRQKLNTKESGSDTKNKHS